jgi:hypothetical protein
MDYVVIAINPALIIVLINSLVYFLLEMFYQGQYPERLHFCLSMFILGAVLIARISMEEGWEHAAPFGIALAVVISLAMYKFVSYKGTSLDAVGWLVNYGMIALAWWCAHRLTWDCTLVDETQDASGEGLLQTVGLEKQAGDEIATNQEQPKEPAAKTRDRSANSFSATGAILPAPSIEKDRKSWWERFLERRRRPHAPGVWIVYFSLAALPIFGFGQAFIPVANAASRRYAFVLLLVYVAAALGLLLTTSFLGLRRYLRQRRLEMPPAMAAAWLSTGAVLVICLLFLTALLPRSNAEYSISALPFSAGSEEHDSSRLALGKEGTKDEQSTEGKGTRQSTDEDLKSGGVQKVSHPEPGAGESSKGDKSESGGQSKGPSQGKDSQTQKSQPGSTGNDQSRDQSRRGDSDGKETSKDRGSSQDRSERADSQQGERQSQPSESSGTQKQALQSPDSAKKASQEDAQTSPPADAQSAAPPDVSGLMDSLAGILKWIFYGAVIVITLWWSWRHRADLLNWLKSLLGGWQSLFGRRKPQNETTIASSPPPKSFLEFSDPFASGIASQMKINELVRYSFEALEAWARDNGCPRGVDQTPLEFARQVGGQAEHLAKPVRTLAEMYSIVAYSSGELTSSAEQHLRSFWEAVAVVPASF